jgi:hypothetical protein
LVLKVDPGLRRRAERLREGPGGLGAHPALAAHDLVHALEGHADVRRELRLGHAERAQVSLEQDQAGMAGEAPELAGGSALFAGFPRANAAPFDPGGARPVPWSPP